MPEPRAPDGRSLLDLTEPELAALAPTSPAAAQVYATLRLARLSMPSRNGMEGSPELMGRYPPPTMMRRGGQPAQAAPYRMPESERKDALAEFLRPLAFPIYGPGQPSSMPAEAPPIDLAMPAPPTSPTLPPIPGQSPPLSPATMPGAAPSAVPAVAPGDFAGAVAQATQNMPNPRPRPAQPQLSGAPGFMTDATAGPEMGGGGPVPQSGLESFFSDPNKRDALRDFGLRLMMAGEAAPGARVGPSFLGAVGQAGMGTIEDKRAREAASAKFAFEQQKQRENVALDERKIASNEALRKATIAQRGEAVQLANEIAAMRATTAQGDLAVNISEAEADAIKNLADPILYGDLMGDADAMRQARQNVYAMYDNIRRQNGLKPQHEGEMAGAAGGQVEMRATQDGKSYVKIGGRWYEE